MATERAEPRPYRFTVDEYLRLVAAGILTEGARTELIDGQGVVLPPADDPHVEGVTRCARAFAAAFAAGRVTVHIQDPLRVGDRAAHDDPEPDVVVARPGGYGAPRRGEVLLLIEVADSSLA